MNILIVYAHPEAQSLNAALKDFALARLGAAGHAVQLSDLYAMQWKAVLDGHDHLDWVDGTRFDAIGDSQRAYAGGRQSPDIAAEQDKLCWADAVLFQFPLWWFGMPAIMKGWVERVYAYGFGYGVGEHSEQRWGDRYGEGTLAGKRAMLIVTAGGWEPHYSARGVNGPIDDLLFPIQHGMLHFPGMDVLPPFVLYRADRIDGARLASAKDDLGARLDALFDTAPLPYRKQNGGDYHIPALTLKEHVAPGRSGFGVHLAQPSSP